MKILIAILLFSTAVFAQDVRVYDYQTQTWKTVYIEVERADMFEPKNDFFQPEDSPFHRQPSETIEVYDYDSGDTYIIEID